VSRDAPLVVWHDGPRAQLRHPFDLADEIGRSIELGRVLVAVGDGDEIVGHAQLLATAGEDAIDGIAVRDGTTFTIAVGASDPGS
jgi:hypothetical protein